MYYSEVYRRPPPPEVPPLHDPSATGLSRGRTTVPLAERATPFVTVDDSALTATELEVRRRVEQAGDRSLAAMSAALRAAKLAGAPFDVAWQKALSEVELALGWKRAFTETRQCWRLAYEDSPDPMQRALERLAALLEPDGALKLM